MPQALSTPISLGLPWPPSSMADSSSSTFGSRAMRAPCCLGAQVGCRLPSPRIVGLAARRPHQLVQQVDLAGHLVAGDLGAAVGGDVVGGGRAARAGLHERGHPLTPLLVFDANDN